jgi:arylsulfatase A-like enzyme
MDMSKYRKYRGLTRRELLKYALYGGLASSIPLGLCQSSCSKKKLFNIILITLDTTRADHMSCYGYHRQTSPNLDKLAEESVLYTNAIAPASWTLPSHASLFTGKFTSSHGANYDPKGPLVLSDAITGLKKWESMRARGLAQNELTLADILRQRGFSTGAVVGGPWLKKMFGLNKGFDYYDDTEISTDNGRLAVQVTDSALKWIEKERNNKFFLFLNYFDPHHPYGPPDGFALSFLPPAQYEELLRGRRTTTGEMIDLYDAEILYMDHYIGKLFQQLKSDNLFDEALIVITSDHGECFGEHGKFLHGDTLYQEEIHVPLFIKYPGKDVLPKRTDESVQLNDIMAIILDMLGIAIPSGIQSGIPPHVGHPILAETYPLSYLSPDGKWRAIFEGDFKFIWNSEGNHKLFNLKNDPREEKNLVDLDAERKKRMMSDIDRYLAKLPRPGPVSASQGVDEDTKNALKSLGYVK